MGVSSMLLADLDGLFRRKEEPFLSSEEIVSELNRLEDRPWPELRSGQPITKKQIASFLAPFGIKPKQLWIDGKKRGYERADFEDVFMSYLPPIQTVEAVEPITGIPSISSKSGFKVSFI